MKNYNVGKVHMIKKIVLFPFIIIAAIGTFTSLLIHIVSLFDNDLFDGYPEFLMKIMFLIFLPVVISSILHVKFYPLDMKVNIKNFFGLDAIIYNCPSWMKYIQIFSFPYIFLVPLTGVLLGFINHNLFLSGFAFFGHYTCFCVLFSFMQDKK